MSNGRQNSKSGAQKMDTLWLEAMSDILNLDHIVIFTDLDLNIVYLNDFLIEKSGLDRKDVLSCNIFDFFSEYNPDKVFDDFLEKLSLGETVNFEIKVKFHIKLNWVKFIAKPLIDPEFNERVGYIFVGKYIDELIEFKNLASQNTLNSDVEEDLKIANRLFKRLLPSYSDLKRVTFNNCILYYKPLRSIGGDWYYFTLTNRKLYLLAGDFMGHGIQAGILSTALLALLKKFRKWEMLKNPLEVLDNFMRKIKYIFKLNSDFNTNIHLSAIAAIYDYATNSAEYISFNYPIYLFRNNDLLKLDNHKNDLNITDTNLKDYKFSHIHLQKNDWIWIFSDGVKDQYGDSQNKPLGLKRLKEILIEGSKMKTAEETDKYFALKRDEWIGNCPQTDDITLLGIKF